LIAIPKERWHLAAWDIVVGATPAIDGLRKPARSRMLCPLSAAEEDFRGGYHHGLFA